MAKTYYTIEAVTMYDNIPLYRDDTRWQGEHNQYNIHDLHEAERYFDEALNDTKGIDTVRLVEHTVTDEDGYDYAILRTWASE